MKKHRFLPLAALAMGLSLFAATGCHKDDCKPGEDCSTDEQELITRLSVEFSDSATGALAFTAVFDDPDGVGGTAATIDTLRFNANQTYHGIIKVQATVSGQTTDITPEIQTENDAHIFCFTPTGAALTITRTDNDGTFPVGLNSRWNVGAASQGTVRITLKHQPDATKDGTCTPGDTDIEVDFPAVVQ